MRRFCFGNPFDVEEMPDDPCEKAKILLQRISGKSAEVTDLSGAAPGPAPDNVPILLAAHSPKQRELLAAAGKRGTGALYFDGPWSTWFDKDLCDYYTLKLVEDDDDQPAEVLGACISEAGNKEAMEQWLQMLDAEVDGIGTLQVMIRVTPPTVLGEPERLEGELE